MPVIAPTILAHGTGYILLEWATMANTDTGAPVSFPDFEYKSFHCTGTPGTTGVATIQGSNDFSGSLEYFTAHDPASNDLVLSDDEGRQMIETSYYVRPSIGSGDGTTSLTVTMLAMTSARR